MKKEFLQELIAIEEYASYSIGYITPKKWKNEGVPKHRNNRLVTDCYMKPSIYKLRAERDILDFMQEINAKSSNLYATDYTVISYNCMMFTCGFMVYDNNNNLVAYYYFTRTRSERYEF